MEFNPTPKSSIYGLHGEFTVGKKGAQLRAQYIETKIRPGQDGNWDNILASQLVPWREIFDVEQVTFDELLQRDLNDSRVAHDLIPYLIGEEGSAARFFPPILVVLVPRNDSSTGIDRYYPESTTKENITSFGSLFDFKIIINGQQETPFSSLEYNPQKSAFIIVDGQHRAMAVLALHRQLTQQWQSSRAGNYESYYKHIEILPDDVRKLELPVCIVFFPELTRDNQSLMEAGISLDKACRELFLTVNRKAQSVSAARNLLLDDDDFGALMMRQTLSMFKGRTENQNNLARIYSFRYGDSDDEGRTVQTGQLEYSSAILIHKLHCIGSFGNSEAFLNIVNPIDISSGVYHRNPSRPADILVGTDLQKWQKLSRKSARTHAPSEVTKAVELLRKLNDVPLMKLYDGLRPFAVHNEAMRRLRTWLIDPDRRADAIQNKCYSLLFEGSGAREVFDDHIQRLEGLKEELESEGKDVSDYILNQLDDGKAVQRALSKHERDIKRARACAMFNIRSDRFYAEAGEELNDQQRLLERKARSIFDTISTQAFQIGYLAAVLSIVEHALGEDDDYKHREELTYSAADLVVLALNNYFEPQVTNHETLKGYVTEKRADVFSTNQQGLRGLLGLSVNELNERQWPFFRYAIFEILFCDRTRKFLVAWLGAQDEVLKQKLLLALAKISEQTQLKRENLIEQAVDKALKASDFEQSILIKQTELRTQGKTDSEVDTEIRSIRIAKSKEVKSIAEEHLKASLGPLSSLNKDIEGSTG